MRNTTPNLVRRLRTRRVVREFSPTRVVLLAASMCGWAVAGAWPAGDGRDKNPFTFHFDPRSVDRPLRTLAGRVVEPAEVGRLYGKPDGFRILADGVDVCSWDYARKCGFGKPRRPVYQDLSDEAGWPNVHVKSGTVAIDPRTGRFAFAEGDTKTGINRVNFLMTPHGYTHAVTVRGHHMYCPNGETWSGIRVVDIADPANPKDVTTLDVGCFGSNATSLDNRLYCLANYYGVTILDLTDNAQPKKIGRWRVTPNSHHGSQVLPFRIGTREYFYANVRGDDSWKDTPPQPRPGAELRTAKGADKRIYEAIGKEIVAKDDKAELGRIVLDGEATSIVLSADGKWLYTMIERTQLGLVSCEDPKAMRLVDVAKNKLRRAAVYAAAKPYFEVRLNAACLSAPGCFVAEYEEIPGRPTGFVHAFEVRRGKLALAWSMQKFPVWGLRLVDVTDPANPVTKDLKIDIMFDTLHGSTAYRATEKETLLYDISDPENPRQIGAIPERLGGFVFDGTKLYAISGKDVAVYDNSDPKAPKELGRLAGVEPSGLAVRDRYAYFTSKGTTLTAVDVSNPAAMKALGSASVPNTKTAGPVVLRPDGKVAIVAEEVGQWLFDLSDPAQPKLAGVYYCAGELQHLLVDHKSGIGTTCTEWGGLQVMVDLADPLKLKTVGYYHSGEFDNYADVFRDGWMYFGKGRKDHVVDCTDPRNPKVVGEYEPEETPYFPVRFWADTGYTVGELGGKNVVTTYDYSDARHPKKLGRTTISHRAHSLATDGKLLLALGPKQLTAVDVSDPANPKVLGVLEHEDMDKYGHYSWQGSGRRIALKGRYAYSLQGVEGSDDPRVAVYDVSNPAALKRIYVTPESRPTFQEDWFDSRILHQGDMINDMIIEGRYMYVSDYWGGVRVYDLRNPRKPVCVDFEFTPYYSLVPKNWSRAEYRKACASGDVEKYFGITTETWARRFEIGRKLSWTDMVYYPGYELFAWNIGELVGDHLIQPKLGGLAVYVVKRTPELPEGEVTVERGNP